jgi:UDP-N-acetylglucosamine--N-acetylmuramyl-(pentapeptide) pyrophosphoryl-undecaprenol N-acetylglucosamine transferase
MTSSTDIRVAIACGGTGGHLFPGLAIAEQLLRRNCAVTLLISPKEVDQQAVKAVSGMEIVTLPAVGLTQGQVLKFARGFARSYRAAKENFSKQLPHAALAMGGFTSAPPILAAKRLGARTFLHESNTIPGRANRWLSWTVDQCFVGFPQALTRLHRHNAICTGTPVRSQFQSRNPAACRSMLGLDPADPVLLVMGGSQGASGINNLTVKALPLLLKSTPRLQLLHLAGTNDVEKVRQACASLGIRALVHAFHNEMELCLGAATVAISRAGASSLAELAAMQVPSVLIPFPAATDNHQYFNARAFEETRAARLIQQGSATPESLAILIDELIRNAPFRAELQSSLARWHMPKAAEQIAEEIVSSARSRIRTGKQNHQPARSGTAERQNFFAT